MSKSSLVSAWWWVATAMAAALLAPCAVAQDEDPEEEARQPLELRAGAIRSDNVRRTSTAEVDGTIWSAGVGVDVQRRGRRLRFAAAGDLDWLEFPKDTFDGKLIGHFDGLASVLLVPEVFMWSFQETYGQLRVDPFAAVTPNNLEDIHYFTTGPDIRLLPGENISIRLSGRYSTTDYGATGLDSDRYRGEVALIRDLRSGAASLNATSERFEFADPVVEDYDRHEAFARYQARGARTELSGDLGYTTIDRAQESSSGLLARLHLMRRISSAMHVRLSAGTQFTDAGDILRAALERQGQEQEDPDEQIGSVLGAGDAFENRFGMFGLHFNRNRTGFGITALRSEERYENAVAFDRTRTSYHLYFLRRLTPAVTLAVSTGRVDQSFASGFDDEESEAGVGLRWALGQAFELRVRYERVDRDSSAGGAEFTESRGSVFFSWAPLGRR